MSDVELERLLRSHGASWRDRHVEEPVVDWQRVTRGSWADNRAAMAGLAVVVVLVAVAAVIVASSGNGHREALSASGRPANPLPSQAAAPDPGNPLSGSPTRYFGLDTGGVRVVTPTFSEVGDDSLVVAIGGTGEGATLYDSRPATVGTQLASCRTAVDVTSYVSSDLLHGRGVAIAGQPREFTTIRGEPIAVPIAVSEAAGELAIVVRSHGCTGPEQIVFLSLHDGSVVGRNPLVNNKLQIDSLAWSADGAELAYRLDPTAYSDFYDPPLAHALATAGTHVLEIHGTPHALESTPKILPAVVPNTQSSRYGPVFWWHGGWAATYDGTLYRLDGRGGLQSRLAVDFPDQVDTVSVDPTQEHVLIGNADASYRWDYGTLSPLRRHLFQPNW